MIIPNIWKKKCSKPPTRQILGAIGYWRRLLCHLTLRRLSTSIYTGSRTFEAQHKLPLSVSDPGNGLNCTVIPNATTHTHTPKKKKHSHTHTHTQRSVQVNLTISGCTISTDFSWVSRNYFAPPFSTPCRSCLCSFTFRNWLRKRSVSPGNLPPLHGIPYNPTHKCQNWISPTVSLDTQVWPIPFSIIQRVWGLWVWVPLLFIQLLEQIVEKHKLPLGLVEALA